MKVNTSKPYGIGSDKQIEKIKQNAIFRFKTDMGAFVFKKIFRPTAFFASHFCSVFPVFIPFCSFRDF